MRCVFFRALSMATPWISTDTCGSTMELALSVLIFGSCCAEMIYGAKYTRRQLTDMLDFFFFNLARHCSTFFRFFTFKKNYSNIWDCFWIFTSKRVQFQAKVLTGTHPYSQLCGVVTRPSPRVLGVEVGLGAAQEGRFEDVSTAAVGKEAALVEVHLLPWSLEVQSHCPAAQGERSVAAELNWAQCSAFEMSPRRNHAASLARTDGTALRNESPFNYRRRNGICSVRVCVFEVRTHLAASVPHFLRIIVGWLEALAGGVDPAQLSAVVSHKQLSCKMKRQSATCHDTPGADGIYSRNSRTKENKK